MFTKFLRKSIVNFIEFLQFLQCFQFFQFIEFFRFFATMLQRSRKTFQFFQFIFQKKPTKLPAGDVVARRLLPLSASSAAHEVFALKLDAEPMARLSVRFAIRYEALVVAVLRMLGFPCTRFLVSLS